MLFLKLWAKNTQIIGRDNMTSYCLITLVIYFLQQPWKMVNYKNQDKDCRILKSIKELQNNCQFYMVQGINYAYNLSSPENKPKIPNNVTTWQLITEFFNFYTKFNFEDLIISPYYGKAIEKVNLTPVICEEYYKQLRTITQYLQGEQANDLQIDRCMCVQDAFCLNQNTAKNILPHSKQYIVLCLQNAKKICENSNNLNLAELYEQLLFETININQNLNDVKELNKTEVTLELKNLKLPSNETSPSANTNTTTTNSEVKLLYTIIPSKTDLRTLSNHFPELKEAQDILRCWCQQYIKAIETILTKLYRMDMQKQLPTLQKQQKLDPDNKDKEFNQTWLISCSIDLWTSRCFQKLLQTSFLQYQLEQTERLHNLRRQDPKFSVNLNAVLKLNALPNYMGIDIQMDLPESSTTTITSLNKKSPLRKFFNVFKNTLQSCNFKETLNINASISAKNEEENSKGNHLLNALIINEKYSNVNNKQQEEFNTKSSDN